MRPGTALSLCSIAAVSVVGLSAAAVQGAGSDGLTDTDVIGGADFSTTFSGGYASDRVPDDPDAPIRTGRYEELPAPAVLANASSVSSKPTESAAIVLAGGDVVEPVPPSRQITLAEVSPGRCGSARPDRRAPGLKHSRR